MAAIVTEVVWQTARLVEHFNILLYDYRHHQQFGETNVPFVFVGDEEFPLKDNMVRPYLGQHLPQAEAAFNHRLRRARRIRYLKTALASWRQGGGFLDVL